MQVSCSSVPRRLTRHCTADGACAWKADSQIVQVCLLDRRAKARGWHGLEVLTIDKFQGQDKQVVLLSLVRSNEARMAGRLLADWRRINVAITRAQRKLLFIGSARTLASVPLWQQLLQLMHSRQWVVQL